MVHGLSWLSCVGVESVGMLFYHFLSLLSDRSVFAIVIHIILPLYTRPSQARLVPVLSPEAVRAAVRPRGGNSVTLQ